MRTWRSLLLCGLCFLVVLRPVSIHAQTLNPTTVQFVASADDSATAADGTPLVTSYQLDFYLIGAAQPFQTLSLGKPTPDASRTITVDFTSLLGSALPFGTVYDATVVAIGPGGSSSSTVSNTFEYLSSCSYGVSPTSESMGAAGGAGNVAVATTSGCAWTATSNAGWLTIASGATGTGSGTVNYTAAANTLTAPQTGTLTVAGQTITITESAVTCSYVLSSTSLTLGAAGGNGSTQVTAASGCAWTATSNVSWITVVAGGSGTGTGTVSYLVAANATKKQRTGTLTIAGTTFTITERSERPAPPGHFRVLSQ